MTKREIRETIVECKDAKELEARRNNFKKTAKRENLFMRCEKNTVVLTNGHRYRFEIVEPESDDFDDEHLPPEAFEGIHIENNENHEDGI